MRLEEEALASSRPLDTAWWPARDPQPSPSSCHLSLLMARTVLMGDEGEAPLVLYAPREGFEAPVSTPGQTGRLLSGWWKGARIPH